MAYDFRPKFALTSIGNLMLPPPVASPIMMPYNQMSQAVELVLSSSNIVIPIINNNVSIMTTSLMRILSQSHPKAIVLKMFVMEKILMTEAIMPGLNPMSSRCGT